MTNSKERFECICKRKKPDRFPIDYLADSVTDSRLKAYYGIETETQLLDILDCDFYYFSCRDISQNESYMPFYKGPDIEVNETQRVCPFGISYERGAFNSKFAVDEAIDNPLKGAVSPKDILTHQWPKVEWFDFDTFHKECEANIHRVIVGGFWSGILGDSCRILGFEKFLYDMAINPEIIESLINKMTDFYLELNEKIFSELKGKLDIWFFGNDFGSQDALLFSEAMFKEFFFDSIKKLTSLAHSYGLKVMMHSCGSISQIVPFLIEAGIDILDPIQVTAKEMEPEILSDKYAKKIIFHGGIDTQQVLPNSSPEEVIHHVKETIAILGKENGYIFAPSQILQSDIPPENISAMYCTAKDYMLL